MHGDLTDNVMFDAGAEGNDNITCFSKLKCPDELPRCKKAKTLKLGYCVECLENEDCEAGSECDTDTNTCGSTFLSGTIWSLRYGDFTLQTFTLQDRRQVCSNILSLIPSAVSPICEVLSVLPGSVVVTGSAQFQDEASGAKLAEILTAQSSATLAALIKNLNTSSVVVEAATSEDPKTARGKPSPPTNVDGVPFCKIPEKRQFVTMTWTPAPGGPTVGYTATCVSPNGLNATSVVVGRSTSGTVLGPLSPSKSYLCGVESYSLTAGSGLTGVQKITTGNCSKPGPPTNVTATGNDGNVTVTWVDGFLGNPSVDTTFEVKCVQSGDAGRAVGPSCTDQAKGLSDTGISPGTEMGTVTQLDNSTTYECYVIATNAIGSTCSSGVSVATWGPPGTADITTANSQSPLSMDVSFDISSSTEAPEEYNVIAVQIGGSCSDPPISAVMGLPEGTTSATIDGLELSTNYTFYVQAYNEFGNTCSQPFDSRTKSFGFTFGVAVSSNLLLATNVDLPFLTQCQVNGITLSDCEQGFNVGPSTAIGIQDDIVYFTPESSLNFVGNNLTACDLTLPGTCNSIEVQGQNQFLDLAIANNPAYMTTISNNITVCDVDGLQLGPCRDEEITGFPDIGTIGIAANQTSGILYITDFVTQQGQVLACNTLSNCTKLVGVAIAPLGVAAGDGKLFVASLFGSVVICDQQGQGVDVDTCETSGDFSFPILPFSTGATYNSGVLYLSSPFASSVAACNVDLDANQLVDCEYYF